MKGYPICQNYQAVNISLAVFELQKSHGNGLGGYKYEAAINKKNQKSVGA